MDPSSQDAIMGERRDLNNNILLDFQLDQNDFPPLDASGEVVPGDNVDVYPLGFKDDEENYNENYNQRGPKIMTAADGEDEKQIKVSGGAADGGGGANVDTSGNGLEPGPAVPASGGEDETNDENMDLVPGEPDGTEDFYFENTTSLAAQPSARGQWSNKWEFLLSCISLSVGLGNVWRFPFVAYKNGGGAFLIPYLIVVAVIGRPMYFMELCLGQFSSKSSIQVWDVCPAFRGIGWCVAGATIYVMSYYCSIMSLTLYYFIASFQKSLPWDNCEAYAEKWQVNCTEKPEGEEGLQVNPIFNKTTAGLYYYEEVLQQAANIDDGIGAPEWRLSLCLFASWLTVFFILIKGVQSSGKVAYFTALFPYVVLVTLLIRAVTLDGATTGILFFLTPDFEKILEPGVWYAAVAQVFYSLNTGFGSVIMYSSYNPLHQNLYKDALIISVMDTGTSLLAGITIFAVLGNLAHEVKLPIDEVLTDGNGLAFISYPQALAAFGGAKQFFSVIFFLMLFSLGIGSVAADASSIITILFDANPRVPRIIYTGGLCLSTFLLGLIYVTPGGQYMLTLVDFYGGSFIVFLTSGIEISAIYWLYGVENFIQDINFMMRVKVGWYWRICWGYVAPIGLTLILVYFFVADYVPLEYNKQELPRIANIFGWVMVGTALAFIPIFAFIAVVKSKKTTLREKIKDAVSPSPEWGPEDPAERAAWIQFVNEDGGRYP